MSNTSLRRSTTLYSEKQGVNKSRFIKFSTVQPPFNMINDKAIKQIILFDFTIRFYISLLERFIIAGYNFQTVHDFFISPIRPCLILRHDVDKVTGSLLQFARYESQHSISASYYFRHKTIIKNPDLISMIADLGHKIGYHTNDLVESRGYEKKAINAFENNIINLRKLCEVRTFTLHGAPYSKIDNHRLLAIINIKDLGLVGTPVECLKDPEIIYMTDSCRKWNNHGCNRRDYLYSLQNYLPTRTSGILSDLESGCLSPVIHMNIHPQHYTDNPLVWIGYKVFRIIVNSMKSAWLRQVNENVHTK